VIVFADFLGRHREQPLLLERASDEIGTPSSV
jgi:hypothetical protein